MIYQYECENGHFSEVTQSIHDEALTECPQCGGQAQRVITGGYGFQVIKTIGALADRNTDRMGPYKRDQRYLEEHGGQEPYKPWWRDGPIKKDLFKKSPEQLKRYIEHGK